MGQPQDVQTSTINKGDNATEPTALFLSRFGLLALFAFLLLAAWNGQMVIVILIGLFLSAAGLAKLWSRLSLANVSCQRLLSEQRAFPGDHIELRLRLTNRKLLPLPWVQVDDEIPDQLAPDDAHLEPSPKFGYRLLSNAASLLWYTVISWRYRLLCRKRGCYPLGPVLVSSGDIFGFYPRSASQPQDGRIIVYPKLFPIDQLGIPSLNPMGETQAERRIFEDPSRTIGVRDYNYHDSLRYINWKASARHQNLQVKVFEPTTTLKVALFLAVDSFPRYQSRSEEDFELGVSTAASVANYIVQQRSSVGLFANTYLPDSGQPIKILPGGGLHQLTNILEALAMVVPKAGGPFEDFFHEEWRGLPWGTTIILVLCQPSPALPALLANLKVAGYKVMVLQIGEGGKNGADQAAAWHNISLPDNFYNIGGGGAR